VALASAEKPGGGLRNRIDMVDVRHVTAWMMLTVAHARQAPRQKCSLASRDTLQHDLPTETHEVVLHSGSFSWSCTVFLLVLVQNREAT